MIRTPKVGDKVDFGLHSANAGHDAGPWEGTVSAVRDGLVDGVVTPAFAPEQALTGIPHASDPRAGSGWYWA